MKQSSVASIILFVIAVAFFNEALSAQQWQSESVSADVQSNMIKLVESALNDPDDEDNSDAAVDVTKATCSIISVERFQTLRDDHQVQIRRAELVSSDVKSQTNFAEAFKNLIEPLVNQTDDEPSRQARFRLKVSRIEISKETYLARVLFFGAKHNADHTFQLNATWQTTWTNKNGGLALASLKVVDQEVIRLKTGENWFTDATSELFANEPAFLEQLKFGKNYWNSRIERFAGSDIYARHGHALGDVDGDGLDDLYVCQPGGLPNRLFLQQANGRLRDASAASGTDWLNDTKSCLLADFDNDGDQDIVVATTVGVYLFANDGTGVFSQPFSLPGIELDVSSLSAVDYDNDGFLDLHVCVYNSNETMSGGSQAVSNVYDLRSQGGKNRLFRNRLASKTADESQAFDFQDVTDSAGMDAGNQRFSFAAAWEDFDNDGDQDLYIANDFGINCLYENQDGKFKEVAKQLGVEDYGPGMSVAWGDYNRDGRPDLYVSNMFSAAGNRVTRQDDFKVNAFGTSRDSFHRFNKGNSLYSFDGDRFQEVQSAGAENAQWAWSSLLTDVDSDGWEDAVVANGYITGPGGGDL